MKDLIVFVLYSAVRWNFPHVVSLKCLFSFSTSTCRIVHLQYSPFPSLRGQEFLRVLVTYHRLISFLLYIVGFVWFVLSLVKRYYMKQFSLFAWTHVALLIVVTQSYLIIQNIFQGMIW